MNTQKQLICTQGRISVATYPRATPALVVILPGCFGPESIETLSVFTSNCYFAVVPSNCLNPTTGSRLQELKSKTIRIEEQDYRSWRSKLQELEIKTARIAERFVGPILWFQSVVVNLSCGYNWSLLDLLCGLFCLEICKPVFLFCGYTGLRGI